MGEGEGGSPAHANSSSQTTGHGCRWTAAPGAFAACAGGAGTTLLGLQQRCWPPAADGTLGCRHVHSGGSIAPIRITRGGTLSSSFVADLLALPCRAGTPGECARRPHFAEINGCWRRGKPADRVHKAGCHLSCRRQPCQPTPASALPPHPSRQAGLPELVQQFACKTHTLSFFPPTYCHNSDKVHRRCLRPD